MSDHVARLPRNDHKDASRSVDLQTLLLATEEFEEFLTELSQLAAVAVGGDISCGITSGSPVTRRPKLGDRGPARHRS